MVTTRALSTHWNKQRTPIDELRKAQSNPAALKQRVLALADSLMAEVADDNASRLGTAQVLMLPLMPHKMSEFMQQKGEIEGKREAAGIIRWFFA
jgi:hypothetical protein